MSVRARAWISMLVTAAAALSPATRAQAPAAAEPLPVSAFFARPDMDRPLLSASGRWAALLVPGSLGRNALAVLDLSGAEPMRVIAHFSDMDIDEVHWVGEDWLVFDVVDLKAGSGERRYAPGLFSVARGGEPLRQLVKLRGSGFVVAPRSASDRRLEYNHRLLAVPRGSQREIIVGTLDIDDKGHVVGQRPFVLNVETGRHRSLELGSDVPAKVQHWFFDAAGHPRAAVSTVDGRTRVYRREAEPDRWRPVMDAPVLGTPWSPRALDADGSLFVTHEQGAGGTRVLAKLDAETGLVRRPPVVSVPGFDFEGALVIEQPGGRILGARALTDGEITVWLDPALKALQDEVDARLAGRVNRITCRRCGEADRVVIVESWSDRDPGTYLLWRGKAPPTLIGRRMKAIDPRRMATLSFERIRARDGRDLPVWITQPQRAEGAPPPPAVVLVHGGPWVRGGRWRWDPLPQFLASRGYAVVEPEFRGSTGYGSEHFRAGWREWGRAMQDDVSDALRWAAAQGLVDGRRACIAGGSYGGYAALMGLVRDPEQYRCGIAWAAVTDPLRLLEGSFWWSDDVTADTRRFTLPQMVGDAKADAEMLQAVSPVRQAARIRAPVLLVHGDADRRVPLVHAREMRDALRQAGLEPEWLVFTGEGHGWQRLENEHAFALRLEAFLARHLMRN